MKDVGRDELVQAIKTVHEGGSLLQPAIATRLIERMSSEKASGLSKRELEVLSVIASGAQNKEIGDRLSLSTNTVKFHVANVFRKLGVQNRTEAVRIARERGLLND
jgi:DNA-binding NarL/FixJ family response regulator